LTRRFEGRLEDAHNNSLLPGLQSRRLGALLAALFTGDALAAEQNKGPRAGIDRCYMAVVVWGYRRRGRLWEGVLPLDREQG
jgi:hypothetical protein